MNDIRFEFAIGKDSSEGIAAELVGAGLVDSRDISVIDSNLQKLIDSNGQQRSVTFPLVRFMHHFITLLTSKYTIVYVWLCSSQQ